ncbi:cobalamin biosynthesis protein CobW [Arenibaculum pallidiluteum]|uniref:cobalamin biosynthesis protein CobW n=1 Tax=Arenibaculum pallidiluteum TaxID=2812559 RepID=UPI001A97471E|nr:cobalamin biosynthesis protein CobW [Arenibaculum pallidiluteum]
MTRKIPATVVTGFLGAGKTSLVRHLVANARGRRLALVINEFGDLGVDRELLAGCGDEACREEDIVELTNGCLCCTVADDFLPTIEALLARVPAPDHIVIETSGLALPKPLVKAFAWPEIRSRVTVDGVVAVVDAEAVADGRFAPDPAAVQAQREADPSLDHEDPLEEVFEDQLLCADMVVLNKADRVDAATLDRVALEISAHLRPAVKVVTSSQGRVDPLVLLGLGAEAETDLASRPSHHDAEDGEHDHDDFESFVVELGPVADPADVEARIRDLAGRHDILRVKGFVDVVGKPMRHVVQAVGERVQRHFDRPWASPEERRSRLVVIGLKGLDRAAIEAGLRG